MNLCLTDFFPGVFLEGITKYSLWTDILNHINTNIYDM